MNFLDILNTELNTLQYPRVGQDCWPQYPETARDIHLEILVEPEGDGAPVVVAGECIDETRLADWLGDERGVSDSVNMSDNSWDGRNGGWRLLELRGLPLKQSTIWIPSGGTVIFRIRREGLDWAGGFFFGGLKLRKI
jgi:hypothetical protein